MQLDHLCWPRCGGLSWVFGPWQSTLTLSGMFASTQVPVAETSTWSPWSRRPYPLLARPSFWRYNQNPSYADHLRTPRKDDSGPWTRPCILAFITRGENLETKTGVGRTPMDKWAETSRRKVWYSAHYQTIYAFIKVMLSMYILFLLGSFWSTWFWTSLCFG